MGSNYLTIALPRLEVIKEQCTVSKYGTWILKYNSLRVDGSSW